MDEASVWLAGKGTSFDVVFDAVFDSVSSSPFVGTHPLDSEPGLYLAASTTLVSPGQLLPLVERVYYLSPDHPDQGYSRMCYGELGPLISKSDDNPDLLEENKTLDGMYENMLHLMHTFSTEDASPGLDFFDMSVEMEAEIALHDSEDTDISDGASFVNDSYESELAE